MSIHLTGGGWPILDDGAVYREFLSEAAERALQAGRLDGPRVALILVRDGDGAEKYAELTASLALLTELQPVPIVVAEGVAIDSALLAEVDGILVWGGLTPAYRDSISGSFGEIRRQVAAGVPYLGFSAGAAIAADRALLGGWKIGDVPVCPEDASEELEEVSLGEGLGLIDLVVDVHAAQWGTLARLIAATEAGLTDGGIAIDEHTALIVGDGPLRVVGRGSVWTVTDDDGSVRVATMGES
ncbi:Type 1 glutamine amidotransferase-like domain-containing protein [Subtercola boreus]|uniref:Peptidase S51 n=1 Tax=Subtercola boreus TaxID=120213 RepID=A0A3E0WBI9_9MICO|nr:Type 1 glutamine amidotransferase-like domain-containing protein [Subtercola boreus]RFA20368.1 peptidase S51 [Subtercola boreus]RFA20521.1 peptidase S51 [Subtercola boreus]RFA26772.1 peptidase S51 [Subtercola boreus]